jgi:hypothetical protein
MIRHKHLAFALALLAGSMGSSALADLNPIDQYEHDNSDITCRDGIGRSFTFSALDEIPDNERSLWWRKYESCLGNEIFVDANVALKVACTPERDLPSNFDRSFNAEYPNWVFCLAAATVDGDGVEIKLDDNEFMLLIDKDNFYTPDTDFYRYFRGDLNISGGPQVKDGETRFGLLAFNVPSGVGANNFLLTWARTGDVIIVNERDVNLLDVLEIE